MTRDTALAEWLFRTGQDIFTCRPHWFHTATGELIDSKHESHRYRMILTWEYPFYDTPVPELASDWPEAPPVSMATSQTFHKIRWLDLVDAELIEIGFQFVPGSGHRNPSRSYFSWRMTKPGAAKMRELYRPVYSHDDKFDRVNPSDFR